MTWPTPSFAALSSPPSLQLSLLDSMFTVAGQICSIPCSASGANAITLVTITGVQTPTAYVYGMSVTFRVPQTTTAAVTLQLGSSLAALPLYHSDGATQVTTALTSGQLVRAFFDSALNSGAGGFVIPQLPAGTSGQVLTWQASGPPLFKGSGGSGGNITLLNTLTAAISATLSDTTSLTSTYNTYLLVWSNILAATTAATFQLQVHSAAAFQATSYVSLVGGMKNTTAVGVNNTTFLGLSNTILVGSTAANVVSGYLFIHNPAGTTNPKAMAGMTSYIGSDSLCTTLRLAGHWQSNGAVDGFQVVMSTGNITSGTLKVYGIT